MRGGMAFDGGKVMRQRNRTVSAALLQTIEAVTIVGTPEEAGFRPTWGCVHHPGIRPERPTPHRHSVAGFEMIILFVPLMVVWYFLLISSAARTAKREKP